MPAELAHCTKQMGRLATLRKMPESDEALQELLRTLAGAAVSNAHAVTIVNEILDSFTFWPTVAEIRQVAWSTRPVEPPRRCVRCGGGGWLFCEKNGYSGAAPCPVCRGAIKEQPEPVASGKDKAAGRDE